jgi:hypothetical protein
MRAGRAGGLVERRGETIDELRRHIDIASQRPVGVPLDPLTSSSS